MSSISQTPSDQPLAPLDRRENVFMGRQDYFSVLLRLVGSELYKIRRRLMSKVLSIVAICVVLLSIVFASLGAIFASLEPASSYLPPACTSSTANDPTQVCLDHTPTQTDLNEAAGIKQSEVRRISSPLRLPGSFTLSVQIIQAVGLILISILAGTIVGGEYGIGTVRVLYTRGPTRTQFLLAKMLTLLTCIIGGFAVLLILGISAGALLNLILNLSTDFSFFTIGWMLHAIAYLGIAILELFLFSLLALCLSTLSKATGAGVAGALIWWGLEGILGSAFLLVGSVTRGVISTILKALPDYFISNNINSLISNQAHYLTGDSSGNLSDLHAILVLLVYAVIFLGSAIFVNWRRDVTN